MSRPVMALSMLALLHQGLAYADVRVAGRVLAPDGQPATSATVWLIASRDYVEPEPRAQTVCDSDGRFMFEGVPGYVLDIGFRRYLLARDEQHRLGFLASFDPSQLETLEIRLQEVGPVEGRVLDEQGQPIAGAVVELRLIREGLFGERGAQIWLGEWLRKLFPAVSGPDGKFVLQDLPKTGVIDARISARGYASVAAHWEVTEPLTVTLAAGGSLRGRIVVDSPPESLDGVRFFCNLTERSRGQRSAKSSVYPAAPPISTRADGTFEADGLYPGQYRVRQLQDAVCPIVIESDESHEVRANETTTIELKAMRAAAIRGRVVAEESGRGVGGAGLMIAWIDGNTIREMHHVTTDESGSFLGYIKPGRILVQIERLAEGFLPPRSAYAASERLEAVAGQTLDWPPFEVIRAAQLAGVVVDEAGRPQADAEVHAAIPSGQWFEPALSRTPIRTEPDGTFTGRQLDPQDTIPFWARTQTAVTEGVRIVQPDRLEAPLRLVVSEKSVFRLRGRVADQAGQPVEGASVRLEWHGSYASRYSPYSGFGRPLETLRSDASGVFESGPLWPGDRYVVRITAEGYGANDSKPVEGVAGSVHDLGMVVVQSSACVVAGHVVDEQGQPLEEVQVFNSGDANRSLRARTDKNGKFALKGLFDGPVYLFAEKDGYRFTMLRVDAGQSEATIRMKSRATPPEPFIGLAGQPSFEEQQALALRLLERLAELPGIEGNQSFGQLVQYLARIDPARAAEWSAKLDGRYDQIVKTQLAQRALEAGDPEEAIRLLAGIEDDGRRVYQMRNFMWDCLPRYPERALRLAEEAVVQARALDEPSRSDRLSELGRLLVQAGRTEAGVALIQEAARNAEALGSDGYDSTVRMYVAKRIAPYDTERALRLVEPLGDRVSHAYGTIAVELGRRNLPKALKLLKRMDGHYIPDQYGQRLAYIVAARDPQAAISLADSIKEASYQVLAYGWLAVALDSHDRALAHQMIDRAFEILRRPGSTVGMNFAGGPLTAVFAARLAYQARLVGYPDPALLTAYTLSLRPSQRQCWKREEFVHSHLRAAAIMALSDPAAARQWLADLEPRVQSVELPSHQAYLWLAGWALADPQKAVELAEQKLAGFDAVEGNLWRAGFDTMLDLLTTPPERRHARDNSIFLNTIFWFPGEEH